MTPETLGYVAGLIDALGRIRVRDLPNGTRLVAVGISSPRVELLRHLAGLTGVRVVEVRRTYDRLGCGDHCQEPHLHVDSHTGRWELTGARAVVVLRAVRPYLVTRGPEVDYALRVAGDSPAKPATRRKMVELGWAS